MAGCAGDLLTTPSAVAPRSSGRPRCCCTTTSTAACDPQTIVELAAEIGHELPADDAEALGAWFADVGRLAARWCATWRPSTTPSR